ncbi:MAG: FtsX-like permease family protein [Acidobacteriia bacterium]|nr:FtsX-like permease family protein [Terriglobia bacterium]
MTSRFELFIARRYLRAHRKEKVISVITVISVAGVAAGVMALIIALAVNNGFRNTLQRNLLGAMADINVMEKQPLYGIENYENLASRLRKLPHITAVAPALYSEVYLTGGPQSTGAVLKGVDIDAELGISAALGHLKEGSLARLRDPHSDPPCLLIGVRMLDDTGMLLNSRVNVISPQGELTPFGPRERSRPFHVCGIFETGFFDFDDKWTYTSLAAAQKALSLGDVINRIEINIDDLDRAPEIAKEIEKVAGPKYTTTTWQEQNKQLLGALNMERRVTMITIGLIELVAALNIFITLVMMVMEKYRDIGVLMSMGARRGQIRRIFMFQGILIGVAGSAMGLVIGYTFSYLANKYRWISLPESVYSMSFVPFEPRWMDGIWVPAAAILVSFLATLYPARNATRISPAEVLRYE